jgi:hypothetical protein
MNDFQKIMTFWIMLAVIIIGNLLLLFALGKHLFIEPSKDGTWLISVFATEILGSFVLAWKYFFRDPVRQNDPLEGRKTISISTDSPNSSLQQQIALAGLVKFIPARKYYAKYDSTLVDMLENATHSFTMVSVNLMTGLPFEGLLSRFSDKLRSNKSFLITISLINPLDEGLVFQFSKLLDINSEDFSGNLLKTLCRLLQFRENLLNEQEIRRFNIRVHNSMPFASAILRDTQTEHGRIQIETKIYKEPVNSSFALEFINGSESKLYQTLLSGYSQLLNDGNDWAALKFKP